MTAAVAEDARARLDDLREQYQFALAQSRRMHAQLTERQTRPRPYGGVAEHEAELLGEVRRYALLLASLSNAIARAADDAAVLDPSDADDAERWAGLLS